jgi:hypothetical protein
MREYQRAHRLIHRISDGLRIAHHLGWRAAEHPTEQIKEVDSLSKNATSASFRVQQPMIARERPCVNAINQCGPRGQHRDLASKDLSVCREAAIEVEHAELAAFSRSVNDPGAFIESEAQWLLEEDMLTGA